MSRRTVSGAVCLWLAVGCGGAAVTPSAQPAHQPVNEPPGNEPPTAAAVPDSSPESAPPEQAEPVPTPDPGAAATPPAAVAPVALPPGAARPTVTPQIMVTIAHLEEDLAAIDVFRPMLARVRSEVELRGNGRAPRACESGIVGELAAQVRLGNTMIGSDARTFRDKLERLCARFERWNGPDEVRQNRIRRYVTRLDRIDEWMRDIQRCIDPGPYDFRCSNSYGAQEPGDAEQARAAMQVVAEVRREVTGQSGRQRFPCRSTIWDRIEGRQWTLSVARAQVPGLASQARSICESIGVDVETLTREVRDIRDRVDRADASLVQQGNSRRSSLLQLRTTFGLPPSP